MRRRIVQVAVMPEDANNIATVLVVADDGTLWMSDIKWGRFDEWNQAPELPDSEPTPEQVQP